MYTNTRLAGMFAAVLAVGSLVGVSGCGSDEPPARQDILDKAPEELHGSSTKAMLYEFRAIVRKRGTAGAKAELPILLENFEGYEETPVGDHLDTYTQIVEKLKSLETMLAGSASDEEVKAVIEEVGKLADTLPGEANENPTVE